MKDKTQQIHQCFVLHNTLYPYIKNIHDGGGKPVEENNPEGLQAEHSWVERDILL